MFYVYDGESDNIERYGTFPFFWEDSITSALWELMPLSFIAAIKKTRLCNIVIKHIKIATFPQYLC